MSRVGATVVKCPHCFMFYEWGSGHHCTAKLKRVEREARKLVKSLDEDGEADTTDLREALDRKDS